MKNKQLKSITKYINDDMVSKVEYNEDGKVKRVFDINIDGTSIDIVNTYYEYSTHTDITIRDKNGDVIDTCFSFEDKAHPNITKKYMDGVLHELIEYDSNGNQTRLVSFKNDGSIDHETNNIYNYNGDFIGSVRSSGTYVLHSNTKNKQTTNINGSKHVTVTDDNTISKYENNNLRSVIKNNKFGNIIEQIDYISGAKANIKYDIKRRMKERIVRSLSDNKILGYTKCEYNNNNNIICKTYNGNDDLICAEITTVTDANTTYERIVSTDKSLFTDYERIPVNEIGYHSIYVTDTRTDNILVKTITDKLVSPPVIVEDSMYYYTDGVLVRYNEAISDTSILYEYYDFEPASVLSSK